MDFKYDILKHPNVKLTTDGGQPPYIHGEPTQAVATLVFDNALMMNAVSVKLSKHLMSFCPRRTWKNNSKFKEDLSMKFFNKKNTQNKETTKLPMSGKVKKGFRNYCVAVLAVTMVLGTSVTAFAANDRLP